MPRFALGAGSRPQRAMTAKRFEKTIGGQRYFVEVTPALGGRWRACIARTAGAPTALMPFYGATPREALDALVRWLSHAHGAAVDSV